MEDEDRLRVRHSVEVVPIQSFISEIDGVESGRHEERSTMIFCEQYSKTLQKLIDTRDTGGSCSVGHGAVEASDVGNLTPLSFHEM
jgi:hypothetical protein